MGKLTIETFTELCRLNLDKNYVQEIYELIAKSDYYSGIVMPQDHITNLYKHSFEIVKDGGKKDDDYLNDFETSHSGTGGFFALSVVKTIIFYVYMNFF